ncbi:hypothetical protein HK102_005003 [Quaeritorhiza haematococci]|nr:hypothetical protein HK102_005003 [Quaeritorhiza haematococci]
MYKGGDESGCTKLEKAPAVDNWIALIERGRCAFVDKVRAMQASGASAVVVGDNVAHAGLLTMFASGDTSDVVIPSVFIAHWEYLDLRFQANKAWISSISENVRGEGEYAGIYPTSDDYAAVDPAQIPYLPIRMSPNDLEMPLLEIIIVTIISPAAVMICLYIIWSYRQYVRRQQELAPLRVVLNLPTKSYSKAIAKENDPTTCMCFC